MSGLGSGTQQTIMPDSDKAFGRYMHKKAADKFDTGNGIFLPPTFFPVVFHVVGNSILVHTDDTMIADGNSVGVFSKVVNYGLCTIKGFLAMGNPVFAIADIQEFLESITVAIFFTTSMKLKLFLFVQGFEFRHIFPAEQL